MAKQTVKKWGAPGWPWELELMALVFVLIAILIPLWISVQSAPDPEEMSLVIRAQMERRADAAATFDDQRNFFWGVFIIGLYVVHLLMAYSSFDLISTSFTHLFAPLVFAMITYYRLAGFEDRGVATDLVSGTFGEAALWALGVLIITLLLAQLRMARHMTRFSDEPWDVSTSSKYDASFFSDLALTVRPLIYPPRQYRVSEDGILVEGWLYILPIPFSSVQSVESVRRIPATTLGHFYATSARAMVRIQLTESKTPIYLSPADRDSFISFCNRRLSRGVVSLARDTNAGTSRQTHG